ncbi:RAN guanine nucleotide release factor [Balamuthia mandrillaris]
MQTTTQPKEQFTARPLFGGAMTCVVPTRFVDVSDIRPVPDNQEVFTDVHTDQSLIIEILEYQSAVSDTDSASYLFNDLAEANEATDGARIVHQEAMSPEDMPNFPDVPKSVLLGVQRIAKFNESNRAKNVVQVYLANVRLPRHTTDLLITLNEPVQVAQESSSKVNVDTLDAATRERMDSTLLIFKAVLKSLRVNDWTLFG